MLACKNNIEEVALQIIEYPNKCKLDYIDEYGSTLLMCAIMCKMKNVALKMLEYPNKCNFIICIFLR